MVRAKKSLGQHFLKDKNIARNITESITRKGNLLEIGPGTGVLTDFLLNSPDYNLKVVELDRESVEYLTDTYPKLASNILGTDFLNIDLSKLFDGEEFSIIGNLPYNISSQIFFKIIDNRAFVPEAVAMIQKEVAERMAARSGNKTYGILSVLMQCWYEIEYLFTVHENVFAPPPKVKSAVIRLTRNDRKVMQCDPALFIRVVKTTFNQRRKTIKNSLKPLLGDRAFDHEYLTLRPERLTIQQFEELTNAVSVCLEQD